MTIQSQLSLCALLSILQPVVIGDLLIPRTKRKHGNQACSDTGPTAWNTLPLTIRTARRLTLSVIPN